MAKTCGNCISTQHSIHNASLIQVAAEMTQSQIVHITITVTVELFVTYF